MFAFSKEICPPSGIESCTFAHFTGIEDDNLIVAKHNLLEIYSMKPGINQRPLHLVAQHSLYGNIQSMAAVKFPGSKDCLVLSFKDAKVGSNFVNINDLQDLLIFILFFL